jgi:hypothetical protein
MKSTPLSSNQELRTTDSFPSFQADDANLSGILFSETLAQVNALLTAHTDSGSLPTHQMTTLSLVEMLQEAIDLIDEDFDERFPQENTPPSN